MKTFFVFQFSVTIFASRKYGNKMTQKEIVVAHVAEMIQSLGVKSVRMDDVAQSLGMSKRTLYEMFGDKEELIYESARYHSEHRAKEILSSLGHYDTGIEQLLACSYALLNGGVMLEVDKRMAINLKKFYPAIHERLSRCHIEQSFAGLQCVLDYSMANGELDPSVDVELMTRLFFNTMQTLLYENTAVIPDEITREEAFSAMLINFLRGIASERGREIIDQILSRSPRPLTLAERRAAKQNKE